MKLSFLFLFLIISINHAYATRPDIDTISILGLTPGLDGKLVGSHISSKIDTLMWSNGIGIVKFSGSYLGKKGEFRIVDDKGLV